MNKYINCAKYVIKTITSHNITGFAAQSCFYITLSAIPFLLVIINLTEYIPISHTDIINIIQSIAPTQLVPLFTDTITDIHNNSNITLTSITALATLWSAGRGFTAIINGLNTIYGVNTHISWIKLRIKSTIYTVLFIVLITISLTALVFGNSLSKIISIIFPEFANLYANLLGKKIILFPLLFTFLFTLIYTYIPNRKSSFIKEIPGAALTALGWYLFSNIYSLYAAHSPNFSYMYRSLTSLVFGQLWIYFSVIIILLGAEFNNLIYSRKDVPG